MSAFLPFRCSGGLRRHLQLPPLLHAYNSSVNVVPSTVAHGVRLQDVEEHALVDDIFAHALKKQTGVSLKYMLDFGANPIERQLILSAQVSVCMFVCV